MCVEVTIYLQNTIRCVTRSPEGLLGERTGMHDVPFRG